MGEKRTSRDETTHSSKKSRHHSTHRDEELTLSEKADMIKKITNYIKKRDKNKSRSKNLLGNEVDEIMKNYPFKGNKDYLKDDFKQKLLERKAGRITLHKNI